MSVRGVVRIGFVLAVASLMWLRFGRGLESKPQRPNASPQQAAVDITHLRQLFVDNRFAEGFAELEAALKQAPLDVRLWQLQASQAMFCADRQLAQQALRRLLDLKGTRRSNLISLARNCSQPLEGNRIDAALRENPSDPWLVNAAIEVAWQRRDLVDVERLLLNAPSHRLITRQRQRLAIASGERLDDGVAADSVLAVDALIARQEPADALQVARKALQSDPWNRALIRRAINLLRGRNPQAAAAFQKLDTQLARLESLSVEAGKGTDADVRSLCEVLGRLERQDEALAWGCGVVAGSFRHPRERIESPRTADLGGNSPATMAANIQFVDVAEAVGLSMIYDNGANKQPGLSMHQWTGGGVGVLDIENDGWPDLYLTQGGNLQQPRLELPDELFRNLRGQSFVRVDAAAGIVEIGYGQGVAVGDIDNDGFDDIFVANVGRNVLLRNQGDGTFIREPFGESKWSTSAAIADLQGDSLPEIFVVNYVNADDGPKQICDHEGRLRVCGPGDFSPEADTCWHNDGRGGFEASTLQPAAAGMGIVIGPFDNERLSAYVANDEAANQLWQFDAKSSSESAVARGLATGANGEVQGGMGIAAGDLNGDLHPDLLVTNYYSEPNNFYASVGEGIFMDASLPSGIASKSLPVLGFGCQAIDCDNDGRLEVFVANGHLDDFRFLGHPFAMPAQLFQQRQGQFEEIGGTCGAPFHVPQLGRAVAKLDWNRDGREDLVTTNLPSAATTGRISLLENRSKTQQKYSSAKLIARRGSRQATGTRAFWRDANQSRCRWVFAGNGYQCSNERAVRVPSNWQIYVKWPGERSEQGVLAGESDFVILGGVGAFSFPK